MLSRVADSIFWMARYVERAENVARFIDVNHQLTLDLGEALYDQWAPLVYTTGDDDVFHDRYGPVTRESVLQFLTFDTHNPNSILSCVQKARENARTVREIISSAMWEELNKLFLMVVDASRQPNPLGQYQDEFYNHVKRASHMLIGVTDTTMSHGEAWHFSRLGRLLERADKTSRILDVKYFILLPKASGVGSSLDVIGWLALLRSASALEMYRRVHGRTVPARVVEFLVLDQHFPRSIHSSIVTAEQSLHAITGTPPGTFNNRAEQELGRLRADLDYMDVNDLINDGFHEFIDGFQGRLNRVGDAVHDNLFAARPVGRNNAGQPLQEALLG